MKHNKRAPEFKALKLQFTEPSLSPHTIFFKEHSVREHTNDKPPGKTLFVINIPPYVDERGIKNAFHAAGVIKSVILSSKPNEKELAKQSIFGTVLAKPSFKIAYIVFEKVSELDQALQLQNLSPVNSDDYLIPCGLKKWISEYNDCILPPKVLQERIETFMKKYDNLKKQEEKKEKQIEKEDEEGWITVTKRGKVQSFARTEKVENKILAKEEKSKQGKELKNFYTFQIRESKMKKIVALRQKFEEDKKKLAQIKQSRRFKPF